MAQVENEVVVQLGNQCMSIQHAHGTQGEPGNEAMSTAYLHF